MPCGSQARVWIAARQALNRSAQPCATDFQAVPSGRFCDGKATDQGGTVKPYEMCRTKDLVFQSGGWASGHFTTCSSCTADMQCTRYPVK